MATDAIEEVLQPSSPEVIELLAGEHRRFLSFLEKRLCRRLVLPTPQERARGSSPPCANGACLLRRPQLGYSGFRAASARCRTGHDLHVPDASGDRTGRARPLSDLRDGARADARNHARSPGVQERVDSGSVTRPPPAMCLPAARGRGRGARRPRSRRRRSRRAAHLTR